MGNLMPPGEVQRFNLVFLSWRFLLGANTGAWLRSSNQPLEDSTMLVCCFPKVVFFTHLEAIPHLLNGSQVHRSEPELEKNSVCMRLICEKLRSSAVSTRTIAESAKDSPCNFCCSDYLCISSKRSPRNK